MASNTLQLVVNVDTGQANSAIAGFNSGLSSVEQQATKAANGTAGFSGGLNKVEISAASAGRAISISFKQAGESMSEAVAKGTILADTFENIVSKIKGAIVESTLYAAKTEQLKAALDAVAKINGASAESVNANVTAVSRLGVSNQAAIEGITRLITAQLDYTKATKLATEAQNLGRLNTLGTIETFSKLIDAIQTGNEKILRTAGSNVSFETAYKKFALAAGRSTESLGELEKTQIRFNAVLGVADRYQGAYAASAGTANGQILSLKRAVDDAKDAVGKEFQPALLLAVKALTELAKFVKDNSHEVAIFGTAILTLASILAAAKIAPLIASITTEIIGLTAALATNPFTALAIGVTIAGVAIYDSYQKSHQLFQELEKGARGDYVRKLVNDGRSVKELEALGVSAEEVKDAFGLLNKVDLGGKQGKDIGDPGYKKALDARVKGEVDEQAALKIKDEARKKSIEAERQADEFRRTALAGELQGIAKIAQERENEIRKLSTFTDDQGAEHKITLNAATRSRIETGVQAKIREEERKTQLEVAKLQEQTSQLRAESSKKNIADEVQIQTNQLELLGAREVITAHELSDKLLAVRKDGAERTLAVELKGIQDRAKQELQAEEVTFRNRSKGLTGDNLAFEEKTRAQKVTEIQEQQRIREAQVRSVVNRQILDDQAKLDAERASLEKSVEDEIRKIRLQTVEIVAGQEKAALDASKQRSLDALELIQAQTLQAKLGVEQAKLAIETDYLKRSAALQKGELDRRFIEEIRQTIDEGKKKGLTQQQIDQETQAQAKKYYQELFGIAQSTDIAIAEEFRKTQIESLKLVIEETKGLYDTIKSEAGGIFDAVLSKSKSFADALKDTLKTAVLTALKDAVTSRVAQQLTQLVSGQKVSLQSSSAVRGPIGAALAALGVGAKPVITPQSIPASKFEQTGHLADAVLTPNGALRVQIENPGTAQRQNQNGDSASGIAAAGAGLLGAALSLTGAARSVSREVASGGSGLAGIASRLPSGLINRTGGILGGIPSLGGSGADLGLGSGTSATNGVLSALLGGGKLTGDSGGGSGFDLLKIIGGGGFGVGGDSGGGILGGLGSLGGLGGLLGAPGGTAPFLGGGGGLGGILGGGGAATAGSSAGGGGLLGGLLGGGGSSGGGGLLGLLGGFGGGGSGLLGGLFNSGSIITGAGTASTAAGIGGIGGSLAGVATSGAGVLAGGGLLFDGLRRGGGVGVAEDVGGGALLGFKAGGPIGAAVGGVLGGLAGLVRLGVKTEAEKIKQKIKDYYGININNAMANQIAQIAKQNYGNQLDVAIRSPQVRELINLYAQSTGQNFSTSLDPKARTVNLVQSTAGSLQQGATYIDGKAFGFQSSLSSFGGVNLDQSLPLATPPPYFYKQNGQHLELPGAGGPPPTQQNITLQIPGSQVSGFFQGQAVQAIDGNPGNVAQASQAGYDASVSRQGTRSTLSEPGTTLV